MCDVIMASPFMSITSRVQQVLVEGVAPELQPLICLDKKVVLDAVVVRVVDRTIEAEILKAFDGKDENAFAIFITLGLKQEFKNDVIRNFVLETTISDFT